MPWNLALPVNAHVARTGTASTVLNGLVIVISAVTAVVALTHVTVMPVSQMLTSIKMDSVNVIKTGAQDQHQANMCEWL